MKDTSHQEEPTAMAGTERTDSVGWYLRQERLRQNKTLQEVAESTCIHANTIQALEEDDRSKLPAEVFVRGFISIYAQYLRLDVQEALNRHGRQTTAEWISPETRAIEFQGDSWPLKQLGLVLVAACVAALLGYGGYLLLKTLAADNLTGDGYQLIARESAMPEIAGDESFVPDFAVTELPEPVLPAPEIPALSPNMPQGPEVQVTAFPAMPLPATATAIGTVIDAPSPPPGGAFNYVLDAEFTESTWLQVRIDGRDPVEYLFQPGERHNWQAREQISLFLGNAGGVDLVLNDQPQPKPGRSGQPARISFPGRRR
jgi:cytoskeleton protein RodZ